MTWLTSQPLSDHVIQFSEPLELLEPRYGLQGVHSYLVLGRERAVLIDTGCGMIELGARVRTITDLPLTVLNTHAHWDHAGGNHQFEERWIHRLETSQVNQPQDIGLDPTVLNRAGQLPESVLEGDYDYQPARATGCLSDGQEIDLGGRVLQVIHTPGHSPGHCAFLLRGAADQHRILFTGDAAYQGPVFACFPGGDPAALQASAWKMAFLDDLSLICPGHQGVIDDPRWLEDFAQGVTAAVGGHLPGRDRTGFVVGREYRLHDFSVWLPGQ
jgi:glyoxylase-like metal-dependent hydrolase (beta-lactamase superfamily II)